MIRRTLIFTAFCLTILVAPVSKAQNDGLSFGTPDPDLDLEFHSAMNGGDLYGGLHIGVMDRKNRMSLTAFINSRLFRQKVLIRRPDAYYQFHEWRGMTGFMIDKSIFPISPSKTRYGGYVEGAAAYSWGTFKGSSIQPASTWQFIPGVGLAITGSSDNVFKLGVQWAEIPKRDIPELRFKIGFSLSVQT